MFKKSENYGKIIQFTFFHWFDAATANWRVSFDCMLSSSLIALLLLLILLLLVLLLILMTFCLRCSNRFLHTNPADNSSDMFSSAFLFRTWSFWTTPSKIMLKLVLISVGMLVLLKGLLRKLHLTFIQKNDVTFKESQLFRKTSSLRETHTNCSSTDSGSKFEMKIWRPWTLNSIVFFPKLPQSSKSKFT